jgi:hypothetical protein
MPRLLSGSTLRKGGSGEFLDLRSSQPQLPPSPTTSTGYTLVTDNLLRTSYRSSLGNLEFSSGTVFSNIANQDIKLIGTGTGIVSVLGGIISTGTNTGALTVSGGIGVSGNLWTGQDIHVNGLTIGQGWQGFNNIVIQGQATQPINDDFSGQESIVIGYDALTGLTTSYKNIAIGRYALSSGTELSNSIAIGDSALKNIGKFHSLPIGAITAATRAQPAVITVNNHGISTGTHVVIVDVIGMTELNNREYYVRVVTANTLSLYSDVNLNLPIDSRSYSNYVSGGRLERKLVWDDNISFGSNSGKELIDGRQNIFLGYETAKTLTTGSYNLFIGHEVGNNMSHGNANISIGGDQIVDGLDNQVNIGSVFYFNGGGYTQINSDLGAGLGTRASSSSTGALVIDGGVGIIGNLVVGELITGTITTSINLDGGILGSIPYQTNAGHTDFIGIGNTNTVLVSNGSTATWRDFAELSAGLASTATNSDNVFVNNAVPLQMYYLGLTEIIGDYGAISSDQHLTYVTTSQTTSSYYVSGTNVLNVPGSIYSNEGNPNLGNLLYSPRIYISFDQPVNPRPGDFWVDANSGLELQWVADGNTAFWIQFTGI